MAFSLTPPGVSPATRNGASIPGWWLTVLPDAGEAGGSFQGSAQPGYGCGQSLIEPDPQRSESEAARRARTKVRRYCASNRLTRLATLTYASGGCHDPLVFRRDLGEFFRALRASLGGKAFPYLWVPEWHKTDHGLHAHFAVGRFVPQTLIRDVWGRGHVHIKLLTDLPVGTTARGEARVAARYLAKYVGKDLDKKRQAGLHRYDVARGFVPRSLRVWGSTLDDALIGACQVMGGELPESVWTSWQQEQWSGPPAVLATWRG